MRGYGMQSLGAWSLAGLLAVALSECACGQDQPLPSPATALNVPGVCAMDAPGPGFVWKPLRTVTHGGVRGRIYVCSKPGTTEMMTLMVLETSISGDNKRAAMLKSQWNGLMASLESDGFQNFNARKPELQAPIGPKITFAISATDSQKQTRVVQAVTLFGARNVFLVQASADRPVDAARLIKTAETLKEQAN